MSMKILVIVGVSVLSVVALVVAGRFLDKGDEAPDGAAQPPADKA